MTMQIDEIKEYWRNDDIDKYLEKLGLNKKHKALYFAIALFGVNKDNNYNLQEHILKKAREIYEGFEQRRAKIESKLITELWENGLVTPVDYFYAKPEILEGKGSKRGWLGVHPQVLEILHRIESGKKLSDLVLKKMNLDPSPYLANNNYWFRLEGGYTILTRTFYKFMYGFMLSNVLCSISDNDVISIKMRSLTRTNRVEVETDEAIEWLRRSLVNINFDVKYYNENKFNEFGELFSRLAIKIKESVSTESSPYAEMLERILGNYSGILGKISKIVKLWLIEIERRSDPSEVSLGGSVGSFTPGFPNTKNYGGIIYINREDFLNEVGDLFECLDRLDDAKKKLKEKYEEKIVSFLSLCALEDHHYIP